MLLLYDDQMFICWLNYSFKASDFLKTPLAVVQCTAACLQMPVCLTSKLFTVAASLCGLTYLSAIFSLFCFLNFPLVLSCLCCVVLSLNSHFIVFSFFWPFSLFNLRLHPFWSFFGQRLVYRQEKGSLLHL